MIWFETEKILAFKSTCPLCDKIIIVESQNSSTNQMNHHLQEDHSTSRESIHFKLITGRTQEELDLQIEKKKTGDLMKLAEDQKERIKHLQGGGK